MLELIGKLGEERLTPEGREALAAIEKKVNALADVVPDKVGSSDMKKLFAIAIGENGR